MKERLNFIKGRKEKIQETYNPVGIQGTVLHDNECVNIMINCLATTTTSHDDVINDDVILPSFDHISEPVLQPTQSHMGSMLDQLDTNIQLRRIAMEAEQVRLQYSYRIAIGIAIGIATNIVISFLSTCNVNDI